MARDIELYEQRLADEQKLLEGNDYVELKHVEAMQDADEVIQVIA